jgi:hypothetical protein
VLETAQYLINLDSPNVLADLLNMVHGSLGAGDDIVSALLLVSSNEVRVVNAGQRLHNGHFLADERLQRRREDLCAIHGVSKVHAADIPTTNDEVIGVNHWQKIVERNVDVLSTLAVDTELGRRTHDDRAVVVGTALSLLGLPNEIALVGNDTSCDGGSVVAAETDQHHTKLGNLAVELEVIDGLLGNSYILAVGVLGNVRSTVSILCLDGVIGVLDIGRVDDKEILRCRLHSEPIRPAAAFFSVRSHVESVK